MYYTEGFPKSDLRQFIANDECVNGIPVYEPQSCFAYLSRLVCRKARYGDDDHAAADDDDHHHHHQRLLAANDQQRRSEEQQPILA